MGGHTAVCVGYAEVLERSTPQCRGYAAVRGIRPNAEATPQRTTPRPYTCTASTPQHIIYGYQRYYLAEFFQILTPPEMPVYVLIFRQEATSFCFAQVTRPTESFAVILWAT